MRKKFTQPLVEYDAAETGSLFDFIGRNISEMVTYRYALLNFVNTRLSSRYRRSTLGFLWSLLNPLFTMLIMAVVFSSLYKLPFSEFSLYLFSGLLPWNLTTSSLLGGSRTLIEAEVYLKKVYVPKILFPLTTISVEAVNFFFSLLSLFLLALLLGARFHVSLLLLPAAVLLLLTFLFGLVLLVSVLSIYFRDLTHILQIVLLGLFYLTPILYPARYLSEDLLRFIILNPFYHFIDLFHLIIYDGIMPEPSSWLICTGLALLGLFAGLFVLQKREKDIVYRL